MFYQYEFIRDVTTVEQFDLIVNIERYLDRRQYHAHVAELNDIFSAYESEYAVATFKTFHDFYFGLLREFLSEYQITLIPDSTISLENLLVLCESLYDLDSIDHELALPLLVAGGDQLETLINLLSIIAEPNARYWISEIESIEPSLLEVLQDIMESKAAAAELPSDKLSPAVKLRVGKFLKIFGNKDSKLSQFIRDVGSILSDEHFASVVIDFTYPTNDFMVRDLYLAYLFGDTPIEDIADKVNTQLTLVAENDSELMQLMTTLEKIHTKYLGE